MYNYLIFSIHVIQLILLSHLLLLLVSSGCLDMRHELTNFRSGRVNFSSQIVVVINSLVQTKNWRCCTKPLIYSNIFLKRDQGVRFFGTYRLRNGFSKFGQVDYPFISSDLLKGFHAEVTESCEFWFSSLWFAPISSICTGDWFVHWGSGESGTNKWLQFLRLSEDGAITPKLVIDWI